MIHALESSIQSSVLARLHRAGKTLGATLIDSLETRPGLWFGFAALCSMAWALMRWMAGSEGGIGLALLRDAGHQVGGGGLLGAIGGTLSAIFSAFGDALFPDPVAIDKMPGRIDRLVWGHTLETQRHHIFDEIGAPAPGLAPYSVPGTPGGLSGAPIPIGLD